MEEILNKETIKLFYISLIWGDVKFQEFAKNSGVTRGFLHSVITGRKNSSKLIPKIQAFIDKNVDDLFRYLE